jgi:hypothetical protein
VNRRQLLRAGGATLAGVVAGAGTAAQLSNNAAAATVAPSGLSVSGADQTTEDGTVADLRLSVEASWSYDLPANSSPETWTTALLVTDGDATAEIDSASGDALYLSNSGTAALAGSVLAGGMYDASTFRAPDDGDTTTVTLGVGLTLTVTGGGQTLASGTATTTVDVAVTNEAYRATEYGSVGGDGAVTVEG